MFYLAKFKIKKREKIIKLSVVLSRRALKREELPSK